jgi:hypothetical protein
MRIALLLLPLLCLIACGKGPEQVLIERQRPEPINCVFLSESAYLCTDGAGVKWICDGRGTPQDSRCIQSSLAGPLELP